MVGEVSVIVSRVNVMKQLPAQDETKRQKTQNAGVNQGYLLTFQQEVV